MASFQLSLKYCMVCLVVLSYNIFDAHASVARKRSSSSVMKGTTPYISDLFLGRCNDYVQCTQSHSLQCEQDKNRTSVNCTSSLGLFLEAYYGYAPCNVSNDAYDIFLQESMIYTAENETLFWSGTKELALNIATVTGRYTSIERTIAGYVLNNLNWCEGESYSCTDCPTGAVYQFWKSASRHFAAQAKGFVSVVLNSTRKGGAFSMTSTFATQELPNLNSDKVTHIYIHLVRNVTADPHLISEDCETGSMLTLQKILTERGFNYTCTSDDPEFILIQCVEYEDAKPCRQYYSNAAVNTLSLLMLILTGIVLYI